MPEHLREHRPVLELIRGETHPAVSVFDTDRWVAMGHCASTAAEVYPPTVNPSNARKLQAARAICDVCIVKTRCLQFALAVPAHIDFGVRGGTTPEERVTLRAPAPPPNAAA